MSCWTPRPLLSLIAIGLISTLSLAAVGRGSEPSPTQAPESYQRRTVVGWNVLIHKGIADRPDTLRDLLAVLENQLFQVERTVPGKALARLRRVTIWVDESEAHHPCMVYHPNAGWLREHGMNPAKAGSVEIANARNFLTWTLDQPWMVLHELAHAYHHQFVPGGFDNQELRASYDRSMAEKRYDSVLHFDGVIQPGYATKNPQEYFAEASEAYFGTNDFYPFVRSELKRHDPALAELLSRIWQAP